MKNNLPLVSVVIPCFNHEKYIVESLQSVKDEGYPKLELILIDDGSSDNSYEIAKEWIEANSDFFVNYIVKKQENKGVCATMNILIGLVNGKYLTGLASDDKLIRGSIYKRVEYLEKHVNKLVVFADARSIDENSDILCEEYQKKIMKANKNSLVCDKTRNSELILRWSVPGPVLLINKKVYTKEYIGLYDESLVGEDRDFFLKCMSRKILGYIPEQVADYREVQTSLSRNQKIKKEVAPYWMLSDKKNLINFKGEEKIFLYLTYIHQLYGVKRLNNPKKYYIQHKFLSLLLKIVYQIVNVRNNIIIWLGCK